MNPDDVCVKYGKKGAKIALHVVPAKPYFYIEIEGDALGLEFRGKLILAQATFEDPSNQLAPFAAGSALFKRSSEKIGLIIER